MHGMRFTKQGDVVVQEEGLQEESLFSDSTFIITFLACFERKSWNQTAWEGDSSQPQFNYSVVFIFSLQKNIQ